MPKIKIHDTELYYEIHGNGEPLLLIAGLGSDVSSWAVVAKKLSKYFRVIIFDNPGMGRSGRMGRPFTVKHMAKYAVGLLDRLKITRAHILGHSLGGYVAQEIAVTHPGRVNKLVLEGTAYISSKKNNALFSAFAKGLKDGDYEEWIKGWVPWLFSRKTVRNKKFIDAFIKGAVKYPYRAGPDGFKAQVQAIASFDMRRKMSLIKAKSLIIEGVDDVLITPKEARALARSIKGNVFKPIKEAGHGVHIEKPREFSSVVFGFLRGLE